MHGKSGDRLSVNTGSGAGDLPPRVAFVAGELGKGGAEKQLVYMCRALRGAGADVRVFVLAPGGFYESALKHEGIAPAWVGTAKNPVSRLRSLARAVREFQPDIIHAAHFYVNTYVALLSRRFGITGIGTIRNDTIHELNSNGLWGTLHLRLPRLLVTNSHAAQRNAIARGIDRKKIILLPNVIDLEAFDREARRSPAGGKSEGGVVAAVVCRLVRAKRVDRFLLAMAEAVRSFPALRGRIVGDGPERNSLQEQARALGLFPGRVEFLGMRDDIPSILKGVDFLVLSSDHEGFPNVLLEAMASALPVVATPAGDSAIVVRDGEQGYIVAADDNSALAGAFLRLAGDPRQRTRMGKAARARVEREYDMAVLRGRLLDVYRVAAAAGRGTGDTRTPASGAHLRSEGASIP